MTRVLNVIMLVLLVIAMTTTILPVNAGATTWPDRYGGVAGGLTWISNYVDAGITWYNGNAHTYRNSGNAPYYIYVKTANWSNCGHPHYINVVQRQDNYKQSLTVNGLIGSSQCKADIRVEGTHRIQVYPGSAYIGGNTVEHGVIE